MDKKKYFKVLSTKIFPRSLLKDCDSMARVQELLWVFAGQHTQKCYHLRLTTTQHACYMTIIFLNWYAVGTGTQTTRADWKMVSLKCKHLTLWRNVVLFFNIIPSMSIHFCQRYWRASMPIWKKSFSWLSRKSSTACMTLSSLKLVTENAFLQLWE